MTSPLEGIKVVEIASYVAAPACGALLADLGAEVVKVEVPWGEIYRHSTPRMAGFDSEFTGGPPFQIYTVPLKLDPKLFAGTSARFFALMNALKLGPYFALGQFETSNLMTSAILLPLAPVATLTGAWIVRRMSPKVFYPFMYVFITLTGLKLVADGVVAVLHQAQGL